MFVPLTVKQNRQSMFNETWKRVSVNTAAVETQ